MSKRKISSTRRKTHRFTNVKNIKHRFIGISISGGKTDKACLAVVEYYTDQKRIFLSRIFDKIKAEELISADLKIHELISQFHGDIEFVAFDAPLTLPKCLHCRLKCPGYEACSESEIIWLRELYSEINKNKKPKKIFTPYTQRCVEAFLNHRLIEGGDIQHCLGSNVAPLATRTQFIANRLNLTCIEVFPKLTVYRIGQALHLSKSYLKKYRHFLGGDESRKLFLELLSEKRQVFFYQQDIKIMTENLHAFDAFICAYTAYLKFLGLTETRPKKFPKNEAWIDFPKD